MRDSLIVRPLYGLLYLLRLLFLSGRVGAWLHNAFYYAVGLTVVRRLRHESKTFTVIGDSLVGGNSMFVRWQERIYTSTPRTWQHCLECVFLRKVLLGGIRRRQLARQGYVVPAVVMISVNTPASGCNLACAHCYADSHPAAVLPKDVLEKILAEEERLGIYIVLLSGGEPFLYKGIWDAFRAHLHTRFFVATNGTQITEDAVRKLCELGNVLPMFSLEGFRAETDGIRGDGVFDQVVEAMSLCKDYRLPYAVTATVTHQNFDVVTGSRFLQMLDDLRCCIINYSSYVAVGTNPHPEWEITTVQSEKLDHIGETIRQTYVMMPMIGRNGTGRVTNCFAGSQYLHVLADGRIEGCPFAHWADPSMNIRDRSILEITASPFFQGLRAIAEQGMPGFTSCRSGRSEPMRRYLVQVGGAPTVKEEAPWLTRQNV